jgi:CP family cyanate transporter-like MFS transporter
MTDSRISDQPGYGERPHRRWLPLAGVWCLYFAFGLNMASLAPLVAVIESDFGMHHTEMGTILGAWQLVFIGAAIPCGMLLDRIGARRALVLGGVLMAVSALMRSYAGTYSELFIAVGLFGLGGPIVSAGAPKVVGQWFQGRQRGLAMGIYITGPGLGVVVCFALTNSVFMPWFDHDWRLVLRVWGWITLLATGAWIVLATISGSPRAEVSTQRVRMTDLIELLALRDVRLLMMMGVGVLMITHGLGNWLPELLRAGGMSVDQAGYWAAIPVVIGILGALVIPRLATPQHRYHVLRGLFLSVAIGCVFYAITSTGPGLVAALVLHGIASASMMTVLILTMLELPDIGVGRAGTATGLFFSAAEFGGVAGPVVLGVLYDVTEGFGVGLGLFAGIGCALFVLVSLLGTEHKNSFDE